jgi:hypothetical protein
LRRPFAPIFPIAAQQFRCVGRLSAPDIFRPESRNGTGQESANDRLIRDHAELGVPLGGPHAMPAVTEFPNTEQPNELPAMAAGMTVHGPSVFLRARCTALDRHQSTSVVARQREVLRGNRSETAR